VPIDLGVPGSDLKLVIGPSGADPDRVVHIELTNGDISIRCELSQLQLRSHRMPEEATQRITIDARPGTLYQDVREALDVIRDAGFRSVVLVGTRE